MAGAVGGDSMSCEYPGTFTTIMLREPACYKGRAIPAHPHGPRHDLPGTRWLLHSSDARKGFDDDPLGAAERTLAVDPHIPLGSKPSQPPAATLAVGVVN